MGKLDYIREHLFVMYLVSLRMFPLKVPCTMPFAEVARRLHTRVALDEFGVHSPLWILRYLDSWVGLL